MSPMLTTLALIAALGGGAAYAQSAAAPGPAAAPPGPPAAKPDTSQGAVGCPMMNGQRMMSGRGMGAHMQNGRMVDKDGKPIMGGMMGANGMTCVPMTSANAAPKTPPKTAK